MLKIAFLGCFGLSLAISVQFTLKMCVTAENSKISLKPPILAVQVRSTLLMLVSPKISSAVLVMISSKSVPICNRLQANEPIAVK